MVRKLQAKNIKISETPDRRGVLTLFENDVTADLLEFVDKTGIGKRTETEANEVDFLDIEGLDRSSDGEEGVAERLAE